MNIVVFCGSGLGKNPAFEKSAREIGTMIGRNGWNLVYGGASIGLMGTVADACILAGGTVHGVIPDFLDRREIAHKNLTKLTVTHSMHERKQVMAREANLFLALPGGFGTFEEILEIITWRQLDLHNSPIGFLNTAGYYNTLLTFFNQAKNDGFIRRDLDFYYHVWNDTAAVARFAEEHARRIPPPQPDLFEKT
jgi:uncharacterized protein (TIGR00730 family)